MLDLCTVISCFHDARVGSMQHDHSEFMIRADALCMHCQEGFGEKCTRSWPLICETCFLWIAMYSHSYRPCERYSWLVAFKVLWNFHMNCCNCAIEDVQVFWEGSDTLALVRRDMHSKGTKQQK